MPYTYDSLTNDIIANMEEDSAEFVSALPSIISRAQSYLQRRVDPVAILRFSSVSASIGAAKVHAGESADALIARADAAMYQAKRTRRGTVVALK